MRMNTTNTIAIMLQTGDIKDFSSFTYLGSTVSTTGGIDEDVKARIRKARVDFNIVQKIWKSRDITTSVKVKLHSKTSFEKNCFSAWASTLNMGLINKVDMVCLSPVGYGV